MAQALVEALEEGAAAREHDAAVHDVRGELGGRAVEGLLDRVDDLLGRLLQRPADLLGREHDGLRQAGDHVATADLGLHLLLHGEGRADLELHLLGGLLADEQLVLALDVADDRLVELVAADADGLRDDDAAEGDHGDLARAAADVDHHGARGLADGQPGPDRGGHRLLDEVGLAGAGGEAGLLDGPFLDTGDAGGHADDDARVRPAVLVHLLDEVAEHLLRHLEVGDHPVLERPDGGDRARRAAEHPLRLDPDGVDLAAALVHGDDRRLRQHDPPPAHVDERVRGAEVDRHVAATEAGEVREKAHGSVARGRAPGVVEPAPGAGPRLLAESSEGGRPGYAISSWTLWVRDRPQRTCSAHWFHLSAVFLPCPEFLAREDRSSCSRPWARMSWDSGSTPESSAPPPVPARALPRCSRSAASRSFFSRASSNCSRWLWSMPRGSPARRTVKRAVRPEPRRSAPPPPSRCPSPGRRG